MKPGIVSVVFILFFAQLLCWSSVYSQNRPELVLPVGHTHGVMSANYSPDQKTIVSASWDRTAKIWEAGTGKLLRTLEGHKYNVNSASYSPDNKTIVTSSFDRTAKIWDAATGELLYSLEGHANGVKDAEYSPDGKTILTASIDSTVRLWDVESRKMNFSLEGHTGEVYSANYSPDGRQIVTASSDSTARVWDLKSRKVIFSLKGHSDIVTSANYSPDGKSIVTASHDYTAIIWDVVTGLASDTLKGHTFLLTSAKYSPDGRTIVTSSSDGTAKIWDAMDGKLIHTMEGHLGDATSVVFYLDGTTTRVNTPARSATYSPDGKTILTTYWDNSIHVWDAGSGILLSSLQGHSSDVKLATFSPDGKTIISSSIDTIDEIWDVKTGKLSGFLKGQPWGVVSSSYSQGEIYSTAHSPYYRTKSWDTESERLRHRSDEKISDVISIDYSPDGKHIVTRAFFDNTAIIWDVETQKEMFSLVGHTDEILSTEYSPDGNTIVTASRDSTAKIWDASNGKMILSLNEISAQVSSASYSPDGKTILTASWDRTARIWDARNGELIISLEENDSGIRFATYSPDGKTVITVHSDGQIKTWDVKTGVPVRIINIGKYSFKDVSFRNELIISTLRSKIKLTDLNTGRELLQFVLIDSSDYLVIHPEGYFDGTPAAIAKLYYVRGLEIIPLEAYYEQFYRPYLWERVINGQEIEKASIDFDNLKPAPLIEITEPTQNLRGIGTLSVPDNLLKLGVKITDRGGGIDELRVFHNGKLYSTEDLDIDHINDTITRNFDIDLLSGVNDIKITAINNERTSKSESLKVSNAGIIQQAGNLYVLAIGINDYKKSSYQLNYAVSDAKAFVEGIEIGARNIFSNVELIRLYDQQATKKNIIAAFDSVKAQANPNDVFIYYFAGHGSMSLTEHNEKPIFYLLPCEVTEMYNPETLENSAISANAIMEFSRDIKAQKQLFILDACQSGGVVEMFANRGAVEERAIALLAQSTGTYFLTASGSEEFAAELSSLGHGVFTYALLQGLAGDADAAKDNNVTVEELLPFVKKTVPELSKQHKGSEQFPVSYGFGQDFPVVVSGIIEVSDAPTKPAGKYDALSIQELEDMKQDAINNEEFENAAEIRDEIKKRNK